MSKMRFSVADWGFWPKAKDQDAFYDRLKSIGYDGVEMVDQSRWERARSAGLEILNLSGPGMMVGLNRREHHAELLPKLRDTIALAGGSGIPQVIVFSGNREGQPDAEGLVNCRRGLEAVLPDAARQGVTLVFEMLNTFDHVDYQADHGAYGFELVRQVASPQLKLVYDLYHMDRMGEACCHDIVGNLSAIAHLHIADAPRRTKPRPGGSPDYATIVPAVVEAGYNGFWGMEFIPEADVLTELAEARAVLLAGCEHPGAVERTT